MNKTDNPSFVGVHKFEAAGLGKAPFRWVGMKENRFQVPGGSKPGGSCDYCGTAIVEECHILSSDGKSFKVGNDCIRKVGDAGLLKAYKTSPEKRKRDADRRHARGLAARKEVENLLTQYAIVLAEKPHPYGFSNRETGAPSSLLDYFRFVQSNCGLTGMIALEKRIRKAIA